MSITVHVDLPRFYHEKTEKLLQLGCSKDPVSSVDQDNCVVLLIEIDLMLSISGITGYMVFLLGPTSIDQLQEQLKAILDGIS